MEAAVRKRQERDTAPPRGGARRSGKCIKAVAQDAQRPWCQHVTQHVDGGSHPGEIQDATFLSDERLRVLPAPHCFHLRQPHTVSLSCIVILSRKVTHRFPLPAPQLSHTATDTATVTDRFHMRPARTVTDGFHLMPLLPYRRPQLYSQPQTKGRVSLR